MITRRKPTELDMMNSLVDQLRQVTLLLDEEGEWVFLTGMEDPNRTFSHTIDKIRMFIYKKKMEQSASAC